MGFKKCDLINFKIKAIVKGLHGDHIKTDIPNSESINTLKKTDSKQKKIEKDNIK